MADSVESPKSVSTVAPDRRTSIRRGLVWSIPLGICGFLVPYVVLGMGTLIRLGTDATPPDGATALRIFIGDGAPSAFVCSLIFASAAVVNFTPSRGIGYIRSLIAMELYAFVAFIAASLLITSFCIMFPFVDLGNPKEAENLCVWLFLEYPELAVLPVTFLPGAIALTYLLIRASCTVNTDQPHSSRIAHLTCSKCTFVDLLVCVTLIAVCMSLLLPVRSQARAQLLAEGVLLWDNQPVDGATMEFYPVLEHGGLGEPAYPEPRTGPDGQFLVVTFPDWRKTYPTVGDFAVTVALAEEPAPEHVLAEKMHAIEPFASARETPIRVTIVEGGRWDLRINLSEWCSPKDREDRPAHP